jgi:acetyltransferase-like isoleucine patch superfamily enzyme
MSLKRLILAACTFAPSVLRLFIWRMLGFRVGRGCHVSPCSFIVADVIELGPGAVIGPFTLIYSPSRLCMGERSRIASFVRIIGYGEAVLERQTFIALGCLIDVTREFTFRLGARSQIGPRGTYYTHGATGLLFNKNYPFRIGSILIGEDTWIGMACLVYPRVTIGDGCVILPGSIVNSDLKAGTALVPVQRTTKVVPSSFIAAGLEDPAGAKLAVMSEFLELLASNHAGSHLEKTATESTLHLPGNQKVILVAPGANVGGGLALKDVVIWSLDRIEVNQIPCFCFLELTVSGSWTPFAETIADHLSTQCGTHFVFASPDPSTRLP